MDTYGVIAICVIVPIAVMLSFYYLLKDLKFDNYPTVTPKKKFN